MTKNFRNLALSMLLSLCAYPGAFAGNSMRDFRSQCERAFGEALQEVSAPGKKPLPTRIEAALEGVSSPIDPGAHLNQLIDEIQAQDPKLADRIRAAARKKATHGARSLRVDTTHLPKKMADFIHGPFERITGPRGVSEPFVAIRAISDDLLEITHTGDQFPILIRWDDVSEPSVGLTTHLGKKYQTLTVPRPMASAKDLELLKDSIPELLSGSRMNRLISGERSPVSGAASLLHDGRISHERPTQAEFNLLREKLDQDMDFRRSTPSLLFVAPTASGKTRILGNSLKSKITQMNGLLSQGPQSKKLSIVMANTPDLVNQLALDLGRQLRSELPASQRFRLIQWGGQNSENFSHSELMRFVEDSDVPVVLVTSSQTLASRVRSEAEMKTLFRLVNSINIDEAHNTGGETFKRVMRIGKEVGSEDRATAEGTTTSLDILGVTASPLSRTERTSDLFEQTYWASLDSPGKFARNATRSGANGKSDTVELEWIRMERQFSNAQKRGEISAPKKPTFFNARENGYEFDSIFKRGASGTHPYVDPERLRAIWKSLEPMMEGHGPGIIQAYPRDADAIAKTLSELSGKNFVSLSGLSAQERDAVTKAFQSRTPYQGRLIDAIVGKIREGLDFPEAGWYFSFKKYVRFPETIQGQGRVVRLNLDKPTPQIVYFGEDLDALAFKDVKELVLKKIGNLPRKIAEGRGFKGARLPRSTHPGSKLGEKAEDLNVAIETLFRANPEWARKFGDLAHPNPETLKAFQDAVLRNRSSQKNREIAEAIKNFTYQLNSFPFYKGSLSETWSFCEKILRHHKNGKPYSTRLSPEELAILNDPAHIEMIQEFRAMKNWLGSIPRSILENLELRPSGVQEMAESVNEFVARNHRVPDLSEPLRKELDRVLQASPEEFHDRLNFRGRTAMDPLLNNASTASLESTVARRFEENGSLPDFYFNKLDEEVELSLKDKVDHTLARKLQAAIQAGDLNVAQFSPELLSALDQSDIYTSVYANIIRALEGAMKNRNVSGVTFERLAQHDEFGSLRVLSKLEEKGYPRSVALKREIESVLAPSR